MTTIERVAKVALDRDWVNLILVTAFDYASGSSNYWLIGEDEVERIGKFYGIKPWVTVGDRWQSLVLQGSGSNVVLGAEGLNGAITQIINDPEWEDLSTRIQLDDALATPDELPDLDGEACDVIVQVALFGEVVYG